MRGGLQCSSPPTKRAIANRQFASAGHKIFTNASATGDLDNSTSNNPTLGTSRTGAVNGANQVFLTNTNNLLLLGGGGTRATNASIVPYMIGTDMTTGTGSTLITYVSGSGFVALPVNSAFVTSTASLNADGMDNFRVVSTSATLNSTTPINALLVSSGTLSVSGTVAVKSGVVDFAWGGNYASTNASNGATFNFGSNTGHSPRRRRA